MKKQVYITGATGFIGGRLAEIISQQGDSKIRANLRRSYAGALRLARFDVEFSSAALTDTEAMKRETSGCETIYHLAFGTGGTPAEQRHITVESTRSLVDAALANGVKRLVYVSTAAVYSNWPDGPMDETAERKPWGWIYADSKLEAENLVLDACAQRGLNAVILQVAGVYGPWATTYTQDLLDQLQKGQVALVNDGAGLSNASYVDDVVQAIILAGNTTEHSGEMFLIRGYENCTRRELYEAYAKMLGYGPERLKSMTIKEIEKERKQMAFKALRQLPFEAVRSIIGSTTMRASVGASPIAAWGRRVKPILERRKTAHPANLRTAEIAAPPLVLPAPFMLAHFARKTDIQSAKASRLLGYKPTFSLERGMGLTEAWARWARFI
jgi:nucleoside-diphosphate-sugar epimerase